MCHVGKTLIYLWHTNAKHDYSNVRENGVLKVKEMKNCWRRNEVPHLISFNQPILMKVNFLPFVVAN